MQEFQRVLREHFSEMTAQEVADWGKDIRSDLNLQHLLELVASSDFNLERALVYGLDQIPRSDPKYANESLSTYFFLISELRNLPRKIRDFALDVSVWLEGKGVYKTFDPHKEFVEKIKPILA